MDFCDRNARKMISKAIGEELRRVRESHGWSRAQFEALLPSGIGERTILAYEHGLRQLTVLRLLELSSCLSAEITELLIHALQRANILLDKIALHVDLHALLDDHRPKFRPMHLWARNSLNRHPDGVAELAPTAVRELADFIGCTHDELASYLARFVPDAKPE